MGCTAICLPKPPGELCKKDRNKGMVVRGERCDAMRRRIVRVGWDDGVRFSVDRVTPPRAA